MVTMADVAARAGVSVSTVSHVVNGTRPVSAESSARVREAIEASGYVPNAVARSLATSSTNLIGVVMSATSNPLFGPLFSAVEEAARRRGFNLLLADSHEQAKLEQEQVQVMLNHQVAGLVLAPAGSGSVRLLDALDARHVPTILIDRFADDRFDQVGTENVASTAELVGHLADRGHRRIAFISGRRSISTTAERLAGYRAGLEAAGLPFDAALIRCGQSLAAPARQATQRLLGLPQPPTAIVSGNNEMTLGMLRGIRDAGLRVPYDIAAAAFDDVEWADLIEPGMTVQSQDVAAIGHTAVNLLVQRIRGGRGRPERRHIDPEFVHRSSCGCDPEIAAPLPEADLPATA